MEVFYYVVECKSFIAAAKKMSVSNSYITKKISKLECDLGVKLLVRSTRAMAITEAGRSFFQYCAKMVNAAQQGYDVISEVQGAVRGKIKIAAPPAFATYCLPQVIKAFAHDYPEVKVQLVLDFALEHIIEEGFDIVLRSAQLESSNLIVRKLMDIPLVISASREYWDQHGLPKQPSDLIDYYWGIYSHAGEEACFSFNKGKQHYSVTVQSQLQCTSLNTLKALLLSGACVGCLPKFMQREELFEGALVQALSSYTLEAAPLYLLTPTREHVPAAVTVFIEYLQRYCTK